MVEREVVASDHGGLRRRPKIGQLGQTDHYV
jgi:hypothetical protein